MNRDALESAERLGRTGVVDEDMPHHDRGDGEEVNAIVQRNRYLALRDPQECFMNEVCRLHPVIRDFISQDCLRPPMQPFVDGLIHHQWN